jgi:hypothetical protein
MEGVLAGNLGMDEKSVGEKKRKERSVKENEEKNTGNSSDEVV